MNAYRGILFKKGRQRCTHDVCLQCHLGEARSLSPHDRVVLITKQSFTYTPWKHHNPTWKTVAWISPSKKLVFSKHTFSNRQKTTTKILMRQHKHAALVLNIIIIYYWLLLYSVILFLQSNSLCSCHTWFWMSDCSFLSHVFLIFTKLV